MKKLQLMRCHNAGKLPVQQLTTGKSNALFWPGWTETFHGQRKAGEFNQAQSYVGGNKSVLYDNNGYAIAPGEVLLLEFDVPDARYWSFQLQSNAMVSMDYANHQTSLNCHQIKVDRDGKARIVLAHEDPGIANWLDVCGRTTGLLIWRWVWTSDNPEVTVRQVTVHELDVTTRSKGNVQRRCRDRHRLSTIMPCWRDTP